MIYLDSAATTKPKPEVIEAMIPYLAEQWFNPSSLYSPATKIKEDIEKARSTIGKFINANRNEIFITSSGSEGNCWAIQGFVNYCNRKNKKATVITSIIEHKSIMECVKYINANVYYVDVDGRGFVNMKMLESLIHEVYNEANEILVSLQYANNEIGTIQDCKNIAKLVHKYDGIFHTDAVQAIGQVTIDVKDLDVDLLTCSGHKLGAPKGVGFLYKKNGIKIDPLIYGSQMDSMRGGTENVPYIIGLAKAIELCDVSDKKIIELDERRNYFMRRFIEEFDCKINGSLNSRLPNNISVTFPQNVTGESLLYVLDMSEIFISTGSACNSKSIKPSYVLKAISLTDEESIRTIRITIPNDITYEQIDYTIDEIKKAIKLIESN